LTPILTLKAPIPHKKTRKTSQLPQFRVYQDKISTADADKYSGQNEPTLVEIKPKLDKICPNISVEIPFRSEFRLISAISGPKKRSRQPLASLSSLALNGAQKAPKIPQNWIENQPNDHTSTFF
jgi:hypothetical protein